MPESENAQTVVEPTSSRVDVAKRLDEYAKALMKVVPSYWKISFSSSKDSFDWKDKRMNPSLVKT